MQLKPPNPQAIVVFGASGDLTKRKILPALYNLAAEGLLPDRYVVTGYAGAEWDDDAFRQHARDAVQEFSRTPLDEAVWKPFADATIYLTLFITVSGIYMWYAIRAERKIGFALLAAGALSFFGIIYAVIR